MIQFFLDQRAVETSKSQLSVHELLQMAGKPTDQDYVVIKDGVEYDKADQLLDIHPGDKITTQEKPDRPKSLIHYKVNGEDQATRENPVSVETILRRAGAAASIDLNDLGSYFVENMTDGSKYENLADPVTIKDGDQFLAIHKGATPVAMTAIETIHHEFEDLGFDPRIKMFSGFNLGQVVVFDYVVDTGRYQGKRFSLGISFQEDGYPEYPPHFVHIADLPEATLTKHSVHQAEGVEWSVFSFPPSDFWDRLPPADKNMKTYLRRHLVRVWNQI